MTHGEFIKTNMQIDIPKGPSFNSPEGRFTATLSEVREVEGKGKIGPYVRFIWDLDPIDDDWDYLVGKNYPLSPKGPVGLLDDLKSWLGPVLSVLNSPDNKLDPDELIGRRADLEIGHIHNETYARPFVHIKGIYPEGTFRLKRVA